MAKGNPHKMCAGYKRNQHKVTSGSLLLSFQAEQRELLFEEMDEDFEAEDDFITYELEQGCQERDLYDDLCLEDAYLYPEFDGISEEFLPENSWLSKEEPYDCLDGGMGYFRYIMESVKPSEVASNDIKWIACKYSLLTAMILVGSFSSEFLNEPSRLLGRYAIKLEERLRHHGIDFTSFRGITEKGWETFQLLTQKAA